MAMALALSCGRRQRGKKGGGSGGDCGGRHFHVHYHLPRRVCASSFVPNLLPRFFSLLSACVLVPPVLFLAVLAFLVLFLWFTLLYFIRSLWNKDINGETFERSSNDHGSDADKRLGEGVAEEGKAEKKTLKISSEDCARRFEIEEVLHVNSDDSQNLPSMVSSDGCLNCKMHTDDEKLIKEVTVFEIKRRESGAAIVCSDGLSQKRQPRDMSIDWFEEETKSGDIIKSGDSSPTVLSTFSSEFHDFSDNNEVVGLATDFLDVNNQNKAVLLDSSSHRGIMDNHCKCGEEFSSDKEAPAYHLFENYDFVDKHETKEVVLGDTVVLTFVDDSANDDSEYREDISEQKDPNNLSVLLDNVADIFYQQQEIHKVVVSDDNKPPEVLFLSGKQTVSSSGEFSSPNENGTSGFPFDSVCEDKNGTVAYPSVASHYNIGIEDDKCEDHTDNNIEEASSIASTNCGSADKHQTIQVLPVCLANGDNIDDVASLGSSICEDVEDKDNKSNANCISEGAPHGNGMPLVRSPASWWNLCGVIDVFAGCKD
ncbi:uncharacterized protein LOC127772788 isoform X1 [Oryza glaberrima]|uniref:Uncharacterized protein n=1 Tax=Oryza glaberrima TaxID=4538 RepID=I1PTY6_ORYGL|nr:uncharacterized protein LOC127772788 isoform X1 [Oryza glaberrima]